MKCIFCQSRMVHYQDQSGYKTNFWCDQCLHQDMIRYQVVYKNYPTSLLLRTLILDKYYVVIDYIDNDTTISLLVGYLLIDSVKINRILSLDLKNPNALLDKIKTLMIFS